VLECLLQQMPKLTRRGIPRRHVDCYEGDPTCDVDPDLANQQCTFALRLCINNTDPRLNTCAATALASIEVDQPRFTSANAADVANLAVLDGQAGSGTG